MNGDQLSRRRFVTGASGLTAAVLLAPEAMAGKARKRPSLRGGKFAEGIASGDPAPRGITLWTRVASAEGTAPSSSRSPVTAASARWSRATSSRRTPRPGTTRRRAWPACGPTRSTTTASRPATRRARSAASGRRCRPTRTSRCASRFFSCQDFTFGYFNAHALLAKEDLDFVVCLGDYIYAEDYYPLPWAQGGVRDDTVGKAETLEQYRAKYAPLPDRPEPAARPCPLPDDQHLGRPRGAGQLRRRRAAPRAGSTRRSTTRTPASGRATRPSSRACPPTARSAGTPASSAPRASAATWTWCSATRACTATTSPAAIPWSARPARSSSSRGGTSAASR